MYSITSNVVQMLSGKKFNLNNDEIVIKLRKHGLTVKTPLYMWNLSKSCYVSTLEATSQENKFAFDIRTKENKHINYFLFYNPENNSFKTELA